MFFNFVYELFRLSFSVYRVHLLHFLTVLGNREKWGQLINMTTCVTLMPSNISDTGAPSYASSVVFHCNFYYRCHEVKKNTLTFPN